MLRLKKTLISQAPLKSVGTRTNSLVNEMQVEGAKKLPEND